MKEGFNDDKDILSHEMISSIGKIGGFYRYT